MERSIISQLTTFFVLQFSVSHIRAADVYLLDTSYVGSTFFSGFDFFAGNDPTDGFVNYQNSTAAFSFGLASISTNGAVYMGVDAETTLKFPGVGRDSVRVSSKKTWTHGLFISDISHMPGGICGTWPAHWTLGPNWPANGEIDIIEGVNNAQGNLMTLHTSPDCAMTPQLQLGTLTSTNCDTSINSNEGCAVLSPISSTYGSAFNNATGGIYATEWTSSAIRIWFFPRSSIPTNILSGTPDPSIWTTPQAIFQGGSNCDIDSHFAQHQIIFDTTFCGSYGDATWASDQVCNKLASSCEDYVAGNPAAFSNAYWEINSVKVFTLGVAPPPSASLSQKLPSLSKYSISASSKTSGAPLQSQTTSINPPSSSKESSSFGTLISSAEFSTFKAQSLSSVLQVSSEAFYTLSIEVAGSTKYPPVALSSVPTDQSSPMFSPTSTFKHSTRCTSYQGPFSLPKSPSFSTKHSNPTSKDLYLSSKQASLPSSSENSVPTTPSHEIQSSKLKSAQPASPHKAISGPISTLSNYMGCFSFPKIERLAPVLESDKMTHSECISRCLVLNEGGFGFQYAGVYEIACVCGRELLDSEDQKFPDAACDIPCAGGGRGESCGGSYYGGSEVDLLSVFDIRGAASSLHDGNTPQLLPPDFKKAHIQNLDE